MAQNISRNGDHPQCRPRYELLNSKIEINIIFTIKSSIPTATAMKSLPFFEPTAAHLIGWFFEGCICTVTGTSIAELLAHKVIQPYLDSYSVNIPGAIAMAAFGIVGALVLTIFLRNNQEMIDAHPTFTTLIYKNHHIISILFILPCSITIMKTFSISHACAAVISFPADGVAFEPSQRFNVAGQLGDPRSCPVAQVWLSDKDDANWLLVGQYLTNGTKWESKNLSLERFRRGSRIEIRALGWRELANRDDLEKRPPVGYLARATAVTIEVKD